MDQIIRSLVNIVIAIKNVIYFHFIKIIKQKIYTIFFLKTYKS